MVEEVLPLPLFFKKEVYMEKLLGSLNNYFYSFGEFGTHKIDFGRITVVGKYRVGQYVKVVGSTLNDGVYLVAQVNDGTISLNGDLIDEEFEGTVFSLAIPRQLIDLADEIKEFKAQNVAGIYVSESFEGYSYTRATNGRGGVATWKDVFKEDLRQYRKMVDSTRGVKMLSVEEELRKQEEVSPDVNGC